MAIHPLARSLLDDLAAPGAPVTDDLVAGRAAARAAALAESKRIGLDHVADLNAAAVMCRESRTGGDLDSAGRGSPVTKGVAAIMRG